MTSRRRLLTLAGGGVLAFSAAAIGISRLDPMPAEAIEAWQGPPIDLDDPRLWALSYAILAPNPHNIQPWRVDLSEPSRLTLSIDMDRLLPMTDPPGRQVLIGLSCFLELLTIALAERGQAATVSVFPDGGFGPDAVDGRPVATIDLIEEPAPARDPLFGAILDRRSTKEPYDPERALSGEHAAALSADLGVAGLTRMLAERDRTASTLRDIAERAMLVEMETPRTLEESIDLLRIGGAEIARHRDGIDLNGPFFYLMNQAGLITKELSMTPGTMAYQGGIDYALGWARDTFGFGWITSATNSRELQLAAGRAYMRTDLTAASLGVAIHPVSQALQEYPEVAEVQAELNRILGIEGDAKVQMLYRLGYAERPAPSPRRRLRDIVSPDA